MHRQAADGVAISIITVAYNAAATIAETIASVAAQTHPAIDYIVIDGGSSDATPAIIEREADHIAYWVSEPDKGLYDAMNKGLARAGGDYVAFLNADDFYAHSGVVADLAAAAGQSRGAGALGDVVIVDPDDTRRIKRYYSARSFRPWQFRFGHMPPHPGCCLNRRALSDLGGFDTGLKIAADFDLLLRYYRHVDARPVATGKTAVVMRAGGVSTAGLASARRINREVAAVCGKNRLWTHPALLWSRYAVKSAQLITRPGDYPAASAS